jgi:hypothetical protein
MSNVVIADGQKIFDREGFKAKKQGRMLAGKRLPIRCLARLIQPSLVPAHRSLGHSKNFPIQGSRSSSGGAGQQQSGAGRSKNDDDEVTWKSFVPLALLAGGAGAYWQITRYQDQQGETAKVQVNQSVGKMQLGGPWKLMDTNAKVMITHSN